jgi:hypothetical protein
MSFYLRQNDRLRLDTEISIFGAQTAAQRIHNIWFQFAETSVVRLCAVARSAI